MSLSDRPWWSFLPVGSLIYFDTESNAEYNGNFIVEVMDFFHRFLYPLTTVLVLAAYMYNVTSTGSFNPSQQFKVYDQRAVDEQKSKEKYPELYKKIFGPSGYADTNLDTAISFSELVSAYRKMGFKEEIMIEGRELPEPNLEQLEQLVKFYEEKN